MADRITPTVRRYAGKNTDAICVSTAAIDIFFSYETPVAFRKDYKLVVRENDWGPTTGRHLNAIDPDKSVRVRGDEFERLLIEATKGAE